MTYNESDGIIESDSGLINMKKKGFTLAEALITLVIIGIIAALTIPAILVNTEQHEYKSALKKALATLNSVIELNIALDGYGPLGSEEMTNATHEDSLFEMFRNRMNVISTSTQYAQGNNTNYAFFTADGMRYEFPTSTPTLKNSSGALNLATNNGHCSSPGISMEDDYGQFYDKPCLVVVDVNGERRPNPRKTTGSYKIPQATGKSKILDVFPILITDKNAVPFGVVAQRAIFQQD